MGSVHFGVMWEVLQSVQTWGSAHQCVPGLETAGWFFGFFLLIHVCLGMGVCTCHNIPPYIV